MPRQRQAVLPGMEETEPTAAPRPRISPPPPMEHPVPERLATEQRTPVAHAPGSPGDSPMLAGKTVWCVDANNLIFQVFHAIPEMTNPTGEPVNAVFGFTRDMLYLLEEKKPDYLFIALDEKGPTFRHTLSDTYKAQRSEMPEDLSTQYPWILRMLSAFRISVLGCPTFEADDILATIARLTEEQGGTCYLVSGDKDCRQLLSERVKIFNVRKNLVFDAAALQADWGIRPEQVVDYQAIVGDSVDNVRGIAGIGPKGASQLLATYGSLAEIFAHVDEISGAKRKQSLQEGQEQAKLSRRLVQLDGYVPIEVDWDAARRGAFDKDEVLDLFKELGFHGFAAKVRAMEVPKAAAVRPPEDWRAEYRIVDTPEGLATLVEELSRQSQFSFDTETTHIWPTWADLVGLSFAWKEGEGWYVPLCGPPGEQCLERQMVLEALRPVLEDRQIKKVGQNLKYDLIVLRDAGIQVQGVAFDTMVASYLLESGERNHNLDELALRYLNHETIKIDSLIGSGRDQLRMDEVAIARVAEYAGEDADVALRLTPILERKLQGSELDGLFESLELPLIDVLVEMESNGIRVDVQRLEELSEQFGRQLQLVETQIYDMAGKPFNIGSPKQLQEILFTELKLPVIKKTKNGPSTDVDVLEELGLVHPLPAKIIEYRQFAKLKNTYVDALPAMINPRTGRVHASFNQVVAATGRLSSHDPNLQNIPIRNEEGRAIRSAFLPGQDDWLLLAADYSQIELRVLAHFCQDPTLLESFARDEDIHARVASEVHGVPLESVTSEMRRQAKAVNFGIIYGQSAFGLARQLGIDQKDAEQFIEAYFARYSSVEQFLNSVLADCRANGYVSTIRGRRRLIAGIRPDVRRQRNPPERTAINTVIQGSAADLIKEAMLAVHRRLKQEKLSARLLLQIHDELVLEVSADDAEALARLVTEEMSQVLSLRVPIKVDVKTGRTWADV